MTLSELFEESRLHFRNHIALKGEGYTYTYEAFGGLVDSFARELTQLGVGKEHIVGLFIDRSPELVVGIFGILRCGAAFLPIDPQNPVKRNQAIVSDARVKVIVTSEKYLESVAAFGCQSIVPHLSRKSENEVISFPTYTESTAAYILFTSGSTGTPKGVVIEHRSVVNLIQSIQLLYPLYPGDTVLFKSPYTFDGSIWEIFGWMVMGGTLYISLPGDEKDPQKLAHLIDREKIAFCFFVPSMLGVFLDFYLLHSTEKKNTTLKWVSVGGEVLNPALVNRFYQCFSYEQSKLINVYGPTETTVYATTHLCVPDPSEEKVPLGNALPHVTIHILDDHRNPLPTRVEGEIYIGGVGVGRMYLNNPDLTAERFISLPTDPSEVIYKTGDKGLLQENGMLAFLGRIDFQVKLRGLRIEVGEIEHALSKARNIIECAVVMQHDNHGDDCLVAYLRLDIPSISSTSYELLTPIQVEEIVAEVSQWLPGYMVPSYYVQCVKFPLTLHEKVDRTALPQITDFLQTQPSEKIEGVSDRGLRVLELWRKVLGISNVGLDDGFFSSGGHSIKAVQLITALMKEFQVEVPLRLFYNGLSLRTLIRGIEQGEYATTLSTAKPLGFDESQGLFPLIPTQKEMWLLHQFDPTGLTHSIQIEFTIRGKVESSRIKRSLNDLVAHEEMFRSTFPVIDETPFQRMVELKQVDLPEMDLSNHSVHDKQRVYDDLCFKHGQRLFHLDHDPLYSFLLLKWSDEEFRLLLVIHHLIFDGWSLALFMERFVNYYRGVPVNHPKWRNRDFASYLQDQQFKHRKEQDIAFWNRQLADLPPRWQLPMKLEAQKEFASRYGDRFWWKLDPDFSSQLDHHAQANNITPFVLFVAAFQLSLDATSKRCDITLGTPYANREHTINSELIGYYTNVTAIRTRWENSLTCREFIQRCNTPCIDAFSHANGAFSEVTKDLVPNSLGQNHLFQAIIVMQNWPHAGDTSDDFSVTQREIGNHTSKTDFLLNIERTSEGYQCWIEYDTMLYDLEVTTTLSKAIKHALHQLVTQPEISIEEVSNDIEKMFQSQPNPTCIAIGEGKLFVQCLELLQQMKFQIKGIITHDTWLMEHLQDKTIPIVPPASLALMPKVDYLFSINNSRILKEKELGMATTLAINYHDALLPQYAGMYATSWAILNGESKHGITWHQISELVDAGDILEQVEVDLGPNDSAFTLNTKCFEAGILGFRRLLAALRDHSLAPLQQDLSLRTHFPLAKRPPNFGTLLPDLTFQEAKRLLLATYFGDHLDNAFALPWIFINHELFIVEKAEVYPSQEPPNASLNLFNHHVGYFCIDGFVALNALRTIKGETVQPEQLRIKHGFVTHPDPLLLEKSTLCFNQFAKHEPYWKEEFERVAFLPYPLLLHGESTKEVTFTVPSELLHRINAKFQGEDSVILLRALFLLFVFRLSREKRNTVGLYTNQGEELPFFSNWVPLTLDKNEEISTQEILETTLRSMAEKHKKGTFLNSLRIRYPSLRSAASTSPQLVLINREEQFDLFRDATSILIDQHKVHIRIPSNGSLGCSQETGDLFHSFLAHILQNSTSPFAAIPVLNFLQTKKVIQTLNQPIPTRLQYHDGLIQFAHYAEMNPDKCGIVDQGTSYTYGRFLHDTRALAHLLDASGVKQNSRVGISMQRSYLYMVAMMGILHHGSCFIPIDPTLPPDRIAFIIHDSGIEHLLADHLGDHNKAHVPTTCISATLLTDAEEHSSQEYSQPHDPAYIIYTSGSTGQPKGVIITRQNLYTFISAAIDRYGITPHDKILQFANLGFDASIEEIFCCFCAGATLYLRPENILQPEDFFKFSLEFCITVWDLPTIFWRTLNMNQSTEFPLIFPNLRLVILGGEEVHLSDLGAWKAHQYLAARLINTYGPTETTVVALTYEFTRADHLSKIPIGRPLPGYSVYIVDDQQQVVPLGVEGELAIGGSGVAKGYLNRKEEQERAFIELELPDSEKRTCYLTGDRVVADQMGLIYFLGRTDQQFKYRGFRIEPAEIEQHLLRIDPIHAAHVALVHPREGVVVLVAFYTTSNGTPVERERIVRELRSRLPDHMIPTAFVALAEWPRTRNGKLDQAKLMHHLEEVSKAKPISDEITDLNQQLILAIWRRILGIQSIGLDDDFFELGGHSLKAVSFVSEIKKQTGVTIPLASLIRNSTVRKCALLLAKENLHEDFTCLVPIRPEGDKTPLFLIHGAGLNVLLYQSLSHHLEKGRPIYAFQASGVDGKKRLKDSIEEMAEEYIEDLIKLYPRGPYLLLGFSLGGFIAYDMAQKLTKRGYQVKLTGLIDSVAYLAHFTDSKVRASLIHGWSALARPVYNLALLISLPFSEKKRFIEIKYRNVRLRILSTMKPTQNSEQPHEIIEVGKGITDRTFLKMYEILHHYHLEEALTHIDLFQATQSTFYIFNRKTYGWSKLAQKGLTIHHLPSEHSLLFAPPHDQLFAQLLDHRLHQIETNEER